MPDIDIVDSTWIPALPAVVAPVVADPANWRRWWPGLQLDVSEWRGVKGVRWRVLAVAGGDLHGSAEVWLEPMAQGVVTHFFLRLDRSAGAAGPRVPRRVRERITTHYRLLTKRAFWGLADSLDDGRAIRMAGAPPA